MEQGRAPLQRRSEAVARGRKKRAASWLTNQCAQLQSIPSENEAGLGSSPLARLNIVLGSFNAQSFLATSPVA